MIPTFQRVIKRPHRVYTHKEIDDVLNYLTQPELPRGAIPQISRDTGIPCQTLRDWHQQRTQEAGENWFPLAQGHPEARALSAENEAGIADFIQVNHIQTGKRATRGLLKSLCLVCNVRQNDHERHRERFEASTTFLRAFENRHGLSPRTPQHERRSTLDETYVDSFLRRLHSLSHDYPPEFVFNMDETCWRLFEAPRKVLAEKGCGVKLESTTGETTSFTVLRVISCAGEKLPLWVGRLGNNESFDKHRDSRKLLGVHSGRPCSEGRESSVTKHSLQSSVDEIPIRDIQQKKSDQHPRIRKVNQNLSRSVDQISFFE
jgi:hypothetical protein